MEIAMTNPSYPTAAPASGLRHPLVWVILPIWFLGIMALVHQGLFMTNGRGVPFPLAMAAVIPPLIYLLAYQSFGGMRVWVAELDLAWVVGAQTWRVIGVVFLMLWGLGELPTVFALTAGLGDLAVGVFALTVVLAVTRKADGWQSKARVLFVVGMADFVAAFGTAILSGEGFPLRLAGEAPPLLMQQLPMAMIPAFGVPLFIILHLIAWQKLRHEG
jgi:hypothetical protein